MLNATLSAAGPWSLRWLDEPNETTTTRPVTPRRTTTYTVTHVNGCTGSWGSVTVDVTPPPIPKFVQLAQMRMAVDGVRHAAGLPAGIFTDAPQSGLPIRARHVVELRDALNEALRRLGYPDVVFPEPALTPARAGFAPATSTRSWEVSSEEHALHPPGCRDDHRAGGAGQRSSNPPGFGTYTYDAAGNIITVGGDRFVYDEFGRL